MAISLGIYPIFRQTHISGSFNYDIDWFCVFCFGANYKHWGFKERTWRLKKQQTPRLKPTIMNNHGQIVNQQHPATMKMFIATGI